MTPRRDADGAPFPWGHAAQCCRACFPAWLSRHSRGGSGGAGLFSHSYHAFKNSRVYLNAPGISGSFKMIIKS